MSCLPCSKLSTTEIDVVKFYRKVYKEKGVVFWVYRLAKGESFNFVTGSDFKKIRIEQIEPNFINGAEYFHISEFKAD